MTSNGRWRIEPGLAIQILAWVLAAATAYGLARIDIAVLQSRQVDTDRRLERIEQKLDELLRRP